MTDKIISNKLPIKKALRAPPISAVWKKSWFDTSISMGDSMIGYKILKLVQIVLFLGYFRSENIAIALYNTENSFETTIHAVSAPPNLNFE